MRPGTLMLILALAASGCNHEPHGNRYSFTKPPFIHPKIVEELTTWISDSRDQVVAMNINAQDSNRFFCEAPCEVAPHPDERYPWVSYTSDDANGNRHGFGYRYVGKTRSGVHVLRVADDSGGTGRWISLLFLVTVIDQGMSVDEKLCTIRLSDKRVLLKKVGDIFLGDRWYGDLRVEGDSVVIGPGKEFAEERPVEKRVFAVKIDAQDAAAMHPVSLDL